MNESNLIIDRCPREKNQAIPKQGVRHHGEFIDLGTLMLLRALAGPRACRKRRTVFAFGRRTQARRTAIEAT